MIWKKRRSLWAVSLHDTCTFLATSDDIFPLECNYSQTSQIEKYIDFVKWELGKHTEILKGEAELRLSKEIKITLKNYC